MHSADDDAVGDDSLKTDEVQRLLFLSGQQTRQEMRQLVTDSEKRHQQLIDESERMQREQMDFLHAQNAQLQTRTDQLLEALRVAQTPDPQASTDPPVEATPSRLRRPRFSTASNLVFGAEDTPLRTSLPQRPLPPHLFPQTPQTPAQSRWDDRHPYPRAAKSKKMGIFKPEDGQTAYSWWQGLMQFKSYSKVPDNEIFMGLPGCFKSGRAKEFFNELKPQPATLEVWKSSAVVCLLTSTETSPSSVRKPTVVNSSRTKKSWRRIWTTNTASFLNCSLLASATAKDLPGVGPGVAFPGAPRTPGDALHGYGARSEI